FAGNGEHIALTHRAEDRAIYARGALHALEWACDGKKPGLYDMRDVLGFGENK
ncbi:MAG: 4-hydroxy-tetrahydrodipicolinate reductase, partial [Hyphomicrobiales bacterium]|nr:4-hydroxy-tetrahydrodipicolinate reductase [Hyphomicrobiales bacterium]